MNPIVYVDGKIADLMGRVYLLEAGKLIANGSGCTIDIMVHGGSAHHASARYTVKPDIKSAG